MEFYPKKSRLSLQIEFEDNSLTLYLDKEAVTLDLNEISTLFGMLENLKSELLPMGKWKDEEGKLLCN